MKIISAAPTTPGIDKGSITLKNCLIGPSPRSLLASSKDLSIFSRETKIGKIAKGAQPCVRAMITALELYKIKVRGSLIISNHNRNEFKTPLYPRMTFHKNILRR